LKTKIYVLISFIAAFVLSSCAGVVEVKAPGIKGGKIEKKKYVPKKPPVLFEDFEAGTVVGAYSYANSAGAAYAKMTISNPETDKAHGGRYAARANFDTGTNSDWGCGFGAQSVYGGGFIDARQREYISAWVKAPAGTKYYMFVNEASMNGADGEYWNGPLVTANGKWQLYEFPLEEFYRNIYSGSQDGNNVVDPVGIGTVGAQLGGAQGSGQFFIDDIYFK